MRKTSSQVRKSHQMMILSQKKDLHLKRDHSKLKVVRCRRESWMMRRSKLCLSRLHLSLLPSHPNHSLLLSLMSPLCQKHQSMRKFQLSRLQPNNMTLTKLMRCAHLSRLVMMHVPNCRHDKWSRIDMWMRLTRKRNTR